MSSMSSSSSSTCNSVITVDDFKQKLTERNDEKLQLMSEKDIDKLADEFIAKFRQNLEIERLKSLERHKKMLERGSLISTLNRFLRGLLLSRGDSLALLGFCEHVSLEAPCGLLALFFRPSWLLGSAHS
eukprot:Gb_00011 [translate_table: standard]